MESIEEMKLISYGSVIFLTLLNFAWLAALLWRKSFTTSRIILSCLLVVSTLVHIFRICAIEFQSVSTLMVVPPLRALAFSLFYFYVCTLFPPKWRVTFKNIYSHLLVILTVALIASFANFRFPIWDWWVVSGSRYFAPIMIAICGSYLLLSYLRVLRGRKILEQTNTDPDLFRMRWGYVFFGVGIVLWLSQLFGYFLQSPARWYFAFENGISVLSIWFLTGYAIRQSPFVDDEEIIPGEKSAAKTGLSDSEVEEMAVKLKNLLISSGAYHNPNFKLKDVAKLIGKPPYYASEVLNRGLKTNFFDLVNFLRIEDAKARLRSETEQDKSILEIAYECGYNSKSAFNSAFKRCTGETPSSFRTAKERMS